MCCHVCGTFFFPYLPFAFCLVCVCVCVCVCTVCVCTVCACLHVLELQPSICHVFSYFCMQDGFEALHNLLRWSWSALCRGCGEMSQTAALTSEARAMVHDLQRLVYIASSCLKLIAAFVNEVYPKPGLFMTSSCTFFWPTFQWFSLPLEVHTLTNETA